MIGERKKCLLNGNTHLWGTYDDKEIDLLRPANRFRNEFKTGNFFLPIALIKVKNWEERTQTKQGLSNQQPCET